MGKVPGGKEERLGRVVDVYGVREPWVGGWEVGQNEELVLERSRCGEYLLLWDLALT